MRTTHQPPPIVEYKNQLTKVSPLPEKKVEQEAKDFKPWKSLIDQPLVFQLRGGPIVEGTVKEVKKGYLVLGPTVLKGTKHEARVDWVWIRKELILYLHPKPTEIREREGI